jgi:Spy/CpxP family protein refolding chaperone
MKNKILSGIAALSLAVGAFAASQAPATTPDHTRGRGMHRMQRFAQELNLTDAQKEFAHSLFQQNREANQAVRDQLRQNRQQLSAAIKATNEAEISRLTAEQAQLKGQLSASWAKSMAKFYAQLTPEQKAKADQMHQQFRGPHMNRG